MTVLPELDALITAHELAAALETVADEAGPRP
jgi:hypothetical protein